MFKAAVAAYLFALILITALAAPACAAQLASTSLNDLPPAARASISATLGRDDTGYHLTRTAIGHSAVNRRYGLAASFSPTGATISRGLDSWSLTLTAFGRESAPAPLPPAVVRAEANRVEYHRPGLTEWYINGPIGLEQGFSIAARPAGPRDSRVVVALVGSGLKPVPTGEGGLSLTRSDGSEAFRYGGLAAWDADGRVLPVQLELAGRQVLLQVDDREARYPVTIDPVFQTARLTTLDDGIPDDMFGSSVALSADGGTALISAANKTVGSNTKQGVAYIFTRSGQAWSSQARLTANDGETNDNFGRVALSGDGSTALVAIANKTVGSNARQGAVYVYIRSGTTWSQQTRLSASDGAANDVFGNSVTLSSDGNTTLIGASGKTISAKAGQGAAYAFTRSGNIWSQQARLTASDGAASDGFGYSVALSSNGTTALIGAYYKKVGSNTKQGGAYAFTRTGSTWAQQASLAAASGGAINDYFGSSVALSSDGNTALIGASNKTINANILQGAAYAFTRSGSTWTQQGAMLTSTVGGVNDRFGSPVTLSSDGNTALIGASNSTVNSHGSQGAAYTFTRMAGVWSQQAMLNNSDGESSDSFGSSLALSGDGSIAMIGAYQKCFQSVITPGAAYGFSRSGNSWTERDKLVLLNGETNNHFGEKVVLSGDGSTALVSIANKNTLANSGQGVAYIFNRLGSLWGEQAKLLASDATGGDAFGFDLALSYDGSTALLGAPGKASSQGAAYVFARTGYLWDQQAKLTVVDGAAGDTFGSSVVLSADGNSALAGSPSAVVGANAGQGAAYAFSRSGTLWNQQGARLSAADGTINDHFGAALAISGDGSTALVGEYSKTIGANAQQGTVYPFINAAGSWSQQGLRLTAVNGAANDLFGRSLALATNGSTALIGAPGKTSNQGAAYVFTRSGSIWSQQTQLNASDGTAGDSFGFSVAASADGNTALIGASGKSVGANSGQGATYIFMYGASWNQQGTALTSVDGLPGDGFGRSVSLSADGTIALIGAYTKTVGLNSGQGVVYAYDIYPQHCTAGSYDNGTACTPCPPGSYQNAGGQRSCIQAPPGSYVPSGGATQPIACAAGTAQSGSGTTICFSCSAGTLQPAIGQATCLAIPKAVTGMVYDPLNLQHLYAGIDNAGVYFSLNGGTTWNAATTQPTNNRVKAVLLKPGDAAKQFAGTYGGGVYKSVDSGINWSACGTTGLSNLNVLSLTIDPTGTLYAGTEAGVFVSVDGCGTWTAINNGLP